jgi:hypothetical protein
MATKAIRFAQRVIGAVNEAAAKTLTDEQLNEALGNVSREVAAQQKVGGRTSGMTRIHASNLQREKSGRDKTESARKKGKAAQRKVAKKQASGALGRRAKSKKR